MSAPTDSSKPRLAPGCRMSESPGQNTTLLIPEGALQLKGPSARIIAACDGQRTFVEIVKLLQGEFSSADPGRIQKETAEFLDRLHARRIIEF